MQGRLENEIKTQIHISRYLENSPEYVSKWHCFLQASGTTSGTRLDYVRKIRQYLNYIDSDIMNIPVGKLTIEATESFMISIKLKKCADGMLSDTSVAHQIGFWIVLNNFFKFLADCGYIEENFMPKINKPKAKSIKDTREKRTFLNKKDFNKILRAAKEHSDNPYINRDCFILLMLMTTGIKDAMLSEINMDDIDFEKHTVKVIDAYNKAHIYSINSQTIEYLNKWIDDRSKITESNQKELLVGRKKGRLSAQSVARLVKKYGKEALDRNIVPTDIRYGFCSILYNETQDIDFVSKAVGHANSNETKKIINTKGNEKEIASKLISKMIKI